MEEAERLCDRVAIVDHGRIMAIGTPAELVASLGAEHVVEFAATGGRAQVQADQRALPGVREVRHDNGTFALATSEMHRAVPALLDHLRASGAELSLLETHSATLEDVFVSLTGRHLRDG
jgi:ABC-2 type transport system ATP-binding protein